MSKSAIRLLTLAVCATSLVMVPMVEPAKAASSISKKHKRHVHVQRAPGFAGAWGGTWYAGQAPVARPSGSVCPGMGRSFDCKVWPPPFDEDPDRKVSGSDAGG